MIAVLGAGESGVGAAILGKKKGYEVFVQGRMSSRDYEDKLGNPRTITEWKAKLIGFPNI